MSRQDAGATKPAFLEKLEGVICLIELERLDLRPNGDVGRELQEIDDILSSAVGHTLNGPLLVDQRVVKLWDRAHGDPGEGYGAPFCEDPERFEDQPSDGREYDRAVESARRVVFRPARPVGP